MTDNQKKLMNILREMFQFDQADLDFGSGCSKTRSKEAAQWQEEQRLTSRN
jgi:hypothetical protein